MTIKDTAVTFYILGLITGMVVAFASCSAEAADRPYQQTQQQPHHPTR